MSSGTTFVLGLLAWIGIAIVVLLPLVKAAQRADEDVRRIERQRRARQRLDALLPHGDPPPCLRELDPNGPFDWAELGER